MPHYTRLGRWVVDRDRIFATRFELRSEPNQPVRSQLSVYTDDHDHPGTPLVIIGGQDADNLTWAIKGR